VKTSTTDGSTRLVTVCSDVLNASPAAAARETVCARPVAGISSSAEAMSAIGTVLLLRVDIVGPLGAPASFAARLLLLF
jgi:hypothetical protein